MEGILTSNEAALLYAILRQDVGEGDGKVTINEVVDDSLRTFYLTTHAA